MQTFYKMIGIIALGLVSIFGFIFIKDKAPNLTGSASYARTSYDAIGTATTASTITSLYAGNTKTILSEGFDKLNLDIQYTPKSWDSLVFILVEGSNDDGTTFFPMTLASSTIASLGNSIGLNPEGVTSTSGIPLVFPADNTSVSGTTYYMNYAMDIIADHIKVSVKESTTSTKGTVYIRSTLIN